MGMYSDSVRWIQMEGEGDDGLVTARAGRRNNLFKLSPQGLGRRLWARAYNIPVIIDFSHNGFVEVA